MAYSLNDVLKAIKHPRLILDEIELLYFSSVHSRVDDADCVDILSEDWDVLAILDACRYDMFADTVELPGTLSKVRSKASATDQFLRKNLDGRDATDTVYVTGNPQFYRIQKGIYNVDTIDCCCVSN
jgi:PHD/YefM family antitoxin component YafN of YafNO toxin-antitoxin module